MTSRPRAATIAAALLLVAGASTAATRHAGCTPVEPGGLQAMLDDPSGPATLCLQPGVHPGPVRFGRSVTAWGPREAIVASTGDGTTIRIEAPGVSISGFTVDGSGGRFDRQDAAVHVGADDARVEGLLVRNAVFGILVERCSRAVVADNEVLGSGRGPFGLRGDGIRLWESEDAVLQDNRVLGGRDVVVWYSRRTRVLRNEVSGGRYGTHFMYSHGSVVEDNRYIDDVVGVFIMYSRDVTLRRNEMSGSRGAAGIGLGIKESGNLLVADNVLSRNTTGLYIDTSPVQATESNSFSGNRIERSDCGIAFHKSETRNAFRHNVLAGNRSQVRVDGGGDALGVTWEGNDFDDYRGYDFDGDGVGDVPYELTSLSGRLSDTHPDLAFFSGAPTLFLVDAASRLLPLLAPRPMLVDKSPAWGRKRAEAGAGESPELVARRAEENGR